MKIGFIGGGNMAFAIAGGVLSAGLCNENELFISDVSETALAKFRELGISADTSYECALQGEFIVLAVKPFIYPAALAELKNSYWDAVQEKVFVSIGAGVTVQEVKEYLGFDAKVIRVMPNTPAMVQEGMTVLASECAPATKEEFESTVQIFEAVGKTEVLPESLLNAVIGVSGGSPAYIYILIEAMADAAVRDGIARDKAYKLAAQSLLGSAKMVLETGKHPGELKDMVCSPRGTTIEAVAELERRGFRAAIEGAMKACTEKAEHLK